MSPKKKKPNTRLSPALLGVAERLRQVRESERYSQYELAPEIGVTRVALASFELGRNPVPFSVGFEFCRRLDLSPRWLSGGIEPKRPFVPLAELGLSQADLRKYARRGVDFLSGYDSLLRAPMESWAKENPPDKIIGRMIRGGIEPLARRWANEELVDQLRQAIASLKSSDVNLHSGYAGNVEALLAEVSARLRTRPPARRK